MGGGQEPAAAEPEVEVEVSAPEAAPSSEAAQDVKVSAKEEAPETEAAPEPSGEVEVEVEDGHRVPYQRFKQVLDARNAHRTEVESLHQEIERLKSQAQSWQQPQQQQVAVPPTEPQGDDWWSDTQTDTEQDSPAQVRAIEDLKSRLGAQEVAFQQMVLERELAQAQEKYPGIDRNQMIQAVYQNPTTPVMQVAEQYSVWLAGIEEAAIARYVSGSGEAAPEAAAESPQAPPRPVQSSSSAAASFVGEKKPGTVEEGSKMLREFLKTHNPFAPNQ